MWPAFRTPPPALQQSDELSWVLLRAFAPHDAVAPARPKVEQVVRLSHTLDLAARIATRHCSALALQLGADAARELAFCRLQAVAMDRLLWQLTDELVQTAAALDVPVVLLKHAALRRSLTVQEGERNARDLDILVPSASAAHLHRALTTRGFVSETLDSMYHLAALKRHPGEVIEIHDTLWGIARPGAPAGEGSTATELIRGGLVDDLGNGVHVPTSPLLAAHAIVHGLVQHRTSPEGYPIMRMLADLCALDLNDAQTARALELVAQFADDALVPAALSLARELRRGTDLQDLARMPSEFALLRHVVAACCDPEYRRALRFERVVELHPQGVRRALTSLVTPPEASSAARQTALQRVRKRVERPWALTIELLRGGASYARAQLRRR